jgi:hypothetical protein
MAVVAGVVAIGFTIVTLGAVEVVGMAGAGDRAFSAVFVAVVIDC